MRMALDADHSDTVAMEYLPPAGTQQLSLLDTMTCLVQLQVIMRC